MRDVVVLKLCSKTHVMEHGHGFFLTCETEPLTRYDEAFTSARSSPSGAYRTYGGITGFCTLFLKFESQNPGGSIKDRIGLAIIDTAEREDLALVGRDQALARV
ncbi:Cysteine synthase [compost metagenome]